MEKKPFVQPSITLTQAEKIALAQAWLAEQNTTTTTND